MATRVSEYNEAGYVRDLPPLKQGRDNHGCSYFDNDEGTKVDMDIQQTLILSSHNFQTLLVTGGWTGNEELSSTELLVGTASAWIFTGELPSLRYGILGANIDNKILMTGLEKHLK